MKSRPRFVVRPYKVRRTARGEVFAVVDQADGEPVELFASEDAAQTVCDLMNGEPDHEW